MITGLLKKIFGSRNERLLRQYMHSVRAINALEPAIAQVSDDALKAKTAEFKQRHANGETLDQLLPEAFAVVREAGKRVLNMRHFDVQLVGGIALAPGQDRRDAHRRRQDAGGDAARVSECAVGQGRARGDRQRLPGQARFRVDGAHLRLSRDSRSA